MSEDIKMGLGGKEMADVIGKVFGGAKKETTKTFVYKAKSDGVKELTKEIGDLVEVMSEAKNLNQSQRGVIKLFGGQEKIINNLKKTWNEYVTAVKNGSIDSDGNITISSSQNRKEYNKINRIRGDFLRSASVAKTVFGDDYLSKIVDGSGVDQSVIEEMKSTIQKLLSTESFKNFSQSPEKIAPVLEFLDKVEEKAKAAGMSLEQAFEFANQNIDGFKDLNIDYKDVSQFELVSEVMRLVAQEAENAARQQQNNASAEEEAADQAEESARRTEEAVERETKAYENLEQIRNRAEKSKKEKHTFDDNNQFNQEMYWDKDTDHDVKIESDDIKSYQDALERLNALQQEALRSAQEYQNAYAKAYNRGDDLEANEHLQNMQRQIDYYNEYSDAIDYVQKQLTEATMNFKPGDSWGEDEIGVTIKLLQDLSEQINTIKESFSTIKSPEEFQVLITSIESVSEKLRELTSSFNTAFTSFDDNGEIISITNYFEKLISTIDELQKTMSQLDMNFSVKFGGNSNAKSPLEMADERRREQEAIYDQLLQERSEIEARIYGRYKSAQSPTQMIMSLFGNRKTPGLQNYTEWAAFAEEYSSQAIESQFKKSMSGANSSLRRYIQKIISGANLAGIDVSDIVSKYQPKDVDTDKSVSDINNLADAEDKAKNASEQMSDSLSKLIKTTDLSPIIEQLETLVKQITQISESFTQLTESINNGLQISAKGTEESLQGASDAIKSEGDAAATATPSKEAMAEANRKLSESAKQTEQSTKAASEGIEEEKKSAAGTSNNSGIYRNQRNLVGDNNWSTTEKIGFASNKTINYSHDKDGNVVNTEHIYTDYDKLEKEIISVDQKIIQLGSDIQDNLSQGLPIDSMLEDLKELNQYFSDLQKEMNEYFSRSDYAPGDAHKKAFHENVRKAGETLERRIQQKKDEDAAYTSDQDALLDAMRLADEEKKREQEYKKQRQEAEKEGKRQAKEQEQQEKERVRQTREQIKQSEEATKAKIQRDKEDQKSEEERIKNNQKIHDDYIKKQNQQKKQQEAQQKKTQSEYKDKLSIIKDFGKESSIDVELETKLLKGDNVVEQMTNHIQQLVEKADLASQAIKDIFKMYRNGDISKDDYQDALKLYRSDDIQKGRAKVRDKYNQVYNDNTYNENLDILKEYNKKREDLNDLQIKGVTKKLTEEEENRKSLLESELSLLNNVYNAYLRIDALHSKNLIDDKKASIAKSLYDDIIQPSDSAKLRYGVEKSKLFDATNKRLSKAKAADWRPDGWASEIQKLSDRLDDLQKKAKNIDIADPASADKLKDIRNEIEQINYEYTNLSKSEQWKPLNATWVDSFDNKIAKWMNENKMAAKAFGDQLDEIRKKIRAVDNEGDAAEFENWFSNIQTEAADKHLLGKSLGDRFKDQFKNTMTSLATYYLSFQDFIRYGREAIQVITELDTAMNELKKVSNESQTSYNDFLKRSFDMADDVGGTAQQIIQSTADWKRLGKSFKESQEASQASVKLLNVSEFENIDDATTALVSMRQAFKDNTYDDFIDKLNGVGDSFSSSTDQIAYGMRNVSAVLKVAGNDIDQSIALLTAANDITQDMSKASMGVRTIALRISGTQEAKQELEDLGEDVSDFVVQTQSKVDAQVRKFTATASNPNGISVLDETGRLRNTYDILLDISQVYDEIVAKDNQMGTNTSNALLELLAGKTRSNILASILQNPDLLKNAYEKSKNSEGVGQRELDIYLNSIQAKTTQLQNRIQQLASQAVDSDFLKYAIDGLTKLVELANTLVKTFGALPTVLGTVGGILMQKNGYGFLNFNKITQQWDVNGFSNAITSFIKKAFTKVVIPDDVLLFFKGKNPKTNLFDVLQGSNFSKAPQQIQDYAKECVNAGNATATIGDAIAETGIEVTNFSGLLSNLGKVIFTVGSSMLTMVAITLAINAAIKGIQWVLDQTIFRSQNIIKAGEEASGKIKDIVDSLNDRRDSIIQIGVEIAPDSESVKTLDGSVKEIAKRYDELHDGVNEISNANESLSTEKYQEYLDLCNQLAEQSPSLVTGWDAQGNAIIGLGNTAAEAEAALMRMYEAEKLAANIEIAQNIQDSYAGFKEKATAKETENTNIDTEIKNIESQLKQSKNQQKQISDDILKYKEIHDNAKETQKNISDSMNEMSKKLPEVEMPSFLPGATPYAERIESSNNSTSPSLGNLFPGLLQNNKNVDKQTDQVFDTLKKAKQEYDEQGEKLAENWVSRYEDTLSIPYYVYGLDEEINRIVSELSKSKDVDISSSAASMFGTPEIGEMATFEISGLRNVSTDVLNSIQNQIADYVYNTLNAQTQELQSQFNELNSQRSANELYIKDQTKSIQGIITNYLNTSDVFGEQSTDIQSAILNNLDSLDLSLISNKYGGEIVPYIYGELIQPINDLTPEAQKTLSKLFEIKPDKKSANEYIQSLIDQIKEVSGDDKAAQSIWESLLGVDKVQDEISTAQGDIRKEFIHMDMGTVHEKLTDEQLEQLYGLSLDDLRIYADLVRDGVYETWEELQKAFEDEKKKRELQKDGTLSDLLNDESYQASADKLSSDLSSLTGALETLRTEGSLTAEQMVELQNSFPDLTEFTTESIQTKAFEELDGWISKIREGMDGMSDEGKKQTQTLIQNMVDQYGDLGLDISDIWDRYFANLGVDNNLPQDQANLIRSGFDEQVEKLRSDLAARGEELDTHVLYTLVASDQFSGTAEQILEKYDGAKVYYQITVDEKQAARDIAIAESRIQSEQAKRSAKEARGETITPEDYETELNILNGKVETTTEQTNRARSKWKKALQEGADQETVDGLFSVYQEALSNQQQAEADAANTAREATESSANETLQELEDSNNALKEAQNKVTEAQKDGGEASSELYEAVASEQDNQAEINRRLGDEFQKMADNATGTDKAKWQGQANDYYAAALQAEADAKEQRLIPIQNEYNELQNKATAIQHELTEAEQKHQKVSKKTYDYLISNGKAQIRNLQKQQSEVDKYSDKWWDLQNSIDSMSDSIYEWDTTSKSLIYDQASQLASAISSAMSESISETGLTDDTINALKTAFSDLDGSKFDVSDAFYSTADGVKVNTEALQELTEAEFELIGAPLANEIANIQAQLEKDPGNSALQDKLEDLMETNAKYFAQYEEMQKALSSNAAIDLAEGTSNAGANYDENYGRVKTYKEARKKGLIGTDDFKAWTSYLDVYGRDTLEAYDAISGKIDRYFTENAQTGLTNFLNDMKALGYAAQDANGYWTFAIDDYDAAAKDMQMGSEWFMDTLRKLEDYGMIHTYVSSLNEAQLKTRDVEEQIADAVQTYSDMVARGASDEELQKQIEYINKLESQWQDLDTVTKTWGETTEANRKKEFLNLDDQLSAFEEMYKNADTDAGREAARKAAEEYVKQFGYTLNEAAKEGKFSLSEESLADYKSRTRAGSYENPLSAETFGYTHNQENSADLYDHMVKTLTERKDEIAGITDELSNYSREELLAIGHSDGQWSAGEKELEQLCDTLGVSYENAGLLVDALAGLGLIQYPELTDIPDALADGRAQVEEFLKTKIGKTFKDFNLDADVTKMGADDLNTLIGRYESLRKSMGVETGSDADQFISSKIREAEVQLDIQTRIDGGSRSIEDLRQMTDEELANEFQLDLNTDEGQAKLEELHTQLESMETGYDYTIHVDDTQFAALMEAITGEPYEQEVVLDPNTDELDTTEKQIESNPIEVPVVKQDLKDDIWVKQTNRQQTQQTTQEEPSTYRDNETDRDIRITAHYDGSEVTEGLQQSESEIENTDAVVTMTPDTQEVDDATAEIQKKPIIQTIIQNVKQFGQKIKEKVQTTFGADTSNADKGTEKVENNLNEVNNSSATAQIRVDTSNAMSGIRKVRSELSNLSSYVSTPRINIIADGASLIISQIKQAIDNLKSKTVTLTTVKREIEALGTAHYLGTTSLSRAYAGGKDWTVGKNEKALVNEIGQESRVRDGVWELIPGGPHVEDLKKNDIIY